MKRIITVVLMLTLVLSSLSVAYANNEAVIIEDPNLEIAIRQAINKPTGEITQENMMGIQSLEINNVDINSLEGLQYAKRIESLRINNNDSQLTDLSPLRELVKLRTIVINNAKIEDLTPLENLIQLDGLVFNYNNITDISVLSNLLNLSGVEFKNNNISDITPLYNLSKLRFLDFIFNNISDIEVLSNLTNLEWVVLTGNKIEDIESLKGLTKLEVLALGDNNISNIEPVKGLLDLKELYIGKNNIMDIEALKGLKNLRVLYVQDTNIKDVAVLAKLTKLKELNLGENNINDISPLLPFDRFEYINIDNNPLWEDDGTNKMLGEVTGEEVNKPVYEVWTEPKAKAVVITEGNIESKRDDNSALPIILTTIGGLFIVVFIFMNNKNLKIYAVEDSNDTWAVRMLGKRKIKVHSEEISIDISKELSEIEDEKLKIVFNSSLSVKLLNKKITFIKDNNTFAEITLNESVNIIEITKDGEITVIKK